MQTRNRSPIPLTLREVVDSTDSAHRRIVHTMNETEENKGGLGGAHDQQVLSGIVPPSHTTLQQKVDLMEQLRRQMAMLEAEIQKESVEEPVKDEQTIKTEIQ